MWYSCCTISFVLNPSTLFSTSCDLTLLTGHYSQNKTLKLVCHGYSWPSLCADVQQFCKSYVTCMSIDFIKKLPSSSGFDTILVIVNWLIKQAIFIPAHNTITSVDLACLFVLHVFSKHDIPFHVTSNRGLEFVSNFFCFLDTALSM